MSRTLKLNVEKNKHRTCFAKISCMICVPRIAIYSKHGAMTFKQWWVLRNPLNSQSSQMSLSKQWPKYEVYRKEMTDCADTLCISLYYELILIRKISHRTRPTQLVANRNPFSQINTAILPSPNCQTHHAPDHLIQRSAAHALQKSAR